MERGALSVVIYVKPYEYVAAVLLLKFSQPAHVGDIAFFGCSPLAVQEGCFPGERACCANLVSKSKLRTSLELTHATLVRRSMFVAGASPTFRSTKP